MATSVEDFMKYVESKNVGQAEFLQAVREFVESVWPVLEKYPKYKQFKILE
eukprot:CAMPEP_0196654174 /NCGR_PEP_ID=MMETSP1086-20130531/3864_1 /TAXON_ID=77921 /ORGANISM="Cyanoptyche  gloeocystis , Strain SAG4.97" /LENGTH=50 /DNA_ID=CAMNT_0041985775 /DNA_START=125 /DNA_END=274 /DNA_ORIENTATION=+